MADKTPQKPILKGFTQQDGFRLFAFESMSANQQRVVSTVRADLDLIRRYGIRVQELPLLCRELLERRTDPDSAFRLTFTEDDMRIHQASCRSAQQAAAFSRRPPRRLAAHS